MCQDRAGGVPFPAIFDPGDFGPHDMPFCIDAWVMKPKLEGAAYTIF